MRTMKVWWHVIVLACVCVNGCKLDDAPKGIACPEGIHGFVIKDGVTCENYEDCLRVIEQPEFKGEAVTSVMSDENVLNAIQSHLCPNLTFQCVSGGWCKYVGAGLSCGTGMHMDTDIGQCIPDSGFLCGAQMINCESSGQVCDNGVCRDVCSNGALKCMTTENVHVKGICVDPNTNAAFCGASVDENSKCFGYVTCIDNQSCIEGKCVCNKGFHLGLVNDVDSCLPDTEQACSNIKDNAIEDCTNLTNVLEAECSYKGEGCRVIQCKKGYYKDVNSCVQENEKSCAGMDCASIEGWHSGDCIDGVCVADDCNEPYHVYDGTCELNTDDNCGDHGVRCEVKNASNHCVESGSCEFECNIGYHLSSDGRGCDDDVETNCGYYQKDCTELSGWKGGACKNGACDAMLCVNRMAPSSYSGTNWCYNKSNETKCGSFNVLCPFKTTSGKEICCEEVDSCDALYTDYREVTDELVTKSQAYYCKLL